MYSEKIITFYETFSFIGTNLFTTPIIIKSSPIWIILDRILYYDYIIIDCDNRIIFCDTF